MTHTVNLEGQILTPAEKSKVLDELERQLIFDQLANQPQRLIRQAQYEQEYRQERLKAAQSILVTATSSRFPDLAETAKQCAEKTGVWQILHLALLLVASAPDEQSANWVLDAILGIKWE